VISVSWSPDGQTLASGSDDDGVKLWEAAVIVQTNLYVYVKEGWCRFEPKTENLEWKEPKRELYRSIETPFRNVPRWSSLGMLQRKDLGTDEKHWLLYLEALQAENWAAAALFRGRLSRNSAKSPMPRSFGASAPGRSVRFRLQSRVAGDRPDARRLGARVSFRPRISSGGTVLRSAR